MYITIAEAHNRLSFWINKIEDGAITITRRGKPVGVLISPEEYEQLRRGLAYMKMKQLSRTLSESGLTAAGLYEASRGELEGKQ